MPDAPTDTWQPLSDHLAHVAALATERGGRIGIAEAAALAGRLHDLGKYDRDRGPFTSSNGEETGAVDETDCELRPEVGPDIESGVNREVDREVGGEGEGFAGVRTEDRCPSIDR